MVMSVPQPDFQHHRDNRLFENFDRRGLSGSETSARTFSSVRIRDVSLRIISVRIRNVPKRKSSRNNLKESSGGWEFKAQALEFDGPRSRPCPSSVTFSRSGCYTETVFILEKKIMVGDPSRVGCCVDEVRLNLRILCLAHPPSV